MLARLRAATLVGVEAVLVRVEVDVTAGLPAFATVGLPDSAVRESRERVRAAIRNAGYPFPAERIVVNLAPADLPKAGAAFDLSIALGILASQGAIPPVALAGTVALGELSLDSRVRPVRGVLAAALACRRRRIPTLLVPAANHAEARAVPGLRALPAATLGDAVELLTGARQPPEIPAVPDGLDGRDEPDLADVRGQAHARRALEIAAAGGHHLLLLGPPGVGKTMLARRLPGILPELEDEAAVEASTIWSASGLLPPGAGLLRVPPYRAPHHSVSTAGLIGGGRPPCPGEVTLAHQGVLLLDEAPEFSPHALDALRQPLEEGRVVIARARAASSFPARFQLVATANPCRRGCASPAACTCPPGERDRYLARLSGPLLDRVDLHVELPSGSWLDAAGVDGEPSSVVRARVAAARERQAGRSRPGHASTNAALPARALRRVATPPPEAGRQLALAMGRLGLSTRGYDRVLRVARTIADLDGSEQLSLAHCTEALQYRLPALRGVGS